MPASAARAPDDKPGSERQMSIGKKDDGPPSKFRAIGMLYAKEENGVISFQVLYSETTPMAIKDKLAEMVGIGAAEWKTTK